MTTELTQAARDVLAERRRQVNVEGWHPEHDDQHDGGSLAQAAACYALGKRTVMSRGPTDHYVDIWPWEPGWWKPTPKDRRRELVKAGALVLAEIERLDRAAARRRPDGHPSWICKRCDNPGYCARLHGCDADEIAR